ARVSTVDDAAGLTGQVSVPLALAAQVSGSAGHYGTSDVATAAVPVRTVATAPDRVPTAPDGDGEGEEDGDGGGTASEEESGEASGDGTTASAARMVVEPSAVRQGRSSARNEAVPGARAARAEVFAA